MNNNIFQKKPKCLVILGTYNGERYIDDQIQSILVQEGVEVLLVIRDDGSTDNTVDRLLKYSNEMNVKIERGERIGFSLNYAELLKKSTNFNFDFLAFADQDDHWNPDRLARGIGVMRTAGASFYSSKRRIISETKMNGKIYPKSKVNISFENSLFQNICPGSTLILTRDAVDLTLRHLDAPHLAKMPYDSLIYVLSSAQGELIFDQNPNLNYRLHGQNTIGISRFSVFNVRARIDSLRTDHRIKLEYAYNLTMFEEFDNLFPVLSIFEETPSFRRILEIIMLPKLRVSKIENFLLKVLLICRPSYFLKN